MELLSPPCITFHNDGNDGKDDKDKTDDDEVSKMFEVIFVGIV